MPRNGSGTYTLPQAPFVAGTVISSAAVNSDLSDIASALTGSLPRDGQAGMTGQLKLPDGSSSTPGLAFNNEVSTGFSRVTTGTIGVDILGMQVATITSAGWVGSVTGAAPIGTVLDFAGPSPPAQWYLCYGQAVSRTTFSALFAVIGTTYGPGDGSTTYNLPDLRGYAVCGNDHMGGSSSGRVPSALTVNGGVVGNQSAALITANLPAYTPTGVVNNGAITSTLSTPTLNITGFNSAAPQGGPAFGITTNTNVTVSSSQAASNFAGNAQGGSSQSFSLMQPSFALNKMIFAGA